MAKPVSRTIDFNDAQIQQLFGHEAAEDEDTARLRQYYFKSTTFDQVRKRASDSDPRWP